MIPFFKIHNEHRKKLFLGLPSGNLPHATTLSLYLYKGSFSLWLLVLWGSWLVVIQQNILPLVHFLVYVPVKALSSTIFITNNFGNGHKKLHFIDSGLYHLLPSWMSSWPLRQPNISNKTSTGSAHIKCHQAFVVLNWVCFHSLCHRSL